MRTSQRKRKIIQYNYGNHIVLLIILITCVISVFIKNRNYVDSNHYLIKGVSYNSVNDLYEANMNYIDIFVDGKTPIERIDSLMFVSNHVAYHIDSFEIHPRWFRSYMVDYYCKEKKIILPNIEYYGSCVIPPTREKINDWKQSFLEMYNNDEIIRLSLISNQLLFNDQNIGPKSLKDSLIKEKDNPLLIDMTNNNNVSDLVYVYVFLMDLYGVDNLTDLFMRKKILLLMPFYKKILQSIESDDASQL